jgi:hypothetical protein
MGRELFNESRDEELAQDQSERSNETWVGNWIICLARFRLKIRNRER